MDAAPRLKTGRPFHSTSDNVLASRRRPPDTRSRPILQEVPPMFRRLVPLAVAVLLVAGVAPGRPADDKKNDGDITVKEGEEFKLNKDTITVAKEPDDEGRFPVTVKEATAPTAVKMPAQKWMLGFVPDDKHKEAGVK